MQLVLEELKMKYLKFALLILLFSSCATKKGVVYFQDIEETTLNKIDSVYQHPVIQKNDILEIKLSALDDQSLAPFKFSGSSISTTPGATSAGGNTSSYTVNTDGEIQFPVIGKLRMKGLSIEEAQLLIQDSLSKYVSDPIVQINITNFKFTVLGSANNPGTYQLNEESLNMLQAIGFAGDFNLNGKRNNVLIFREQNGERISARIDFTQSDWMNSEFYYVKQNDVIYIEPNYAEVKSAGMVGSFTELLRVITVATTTYLLFTR